MSARLRANGVIIAIDGPSGAGKSSITKLLARRLGYLHLDTGAMFRAVALMAKRHPNVKIYTPVIDEKLNDPSPLVRELGELAKIEFEGMIEELESMRRSMEAVRDLARTGLPTGDMTEYQWATHRLNIIAGDLTFFLNTTPNAR